MVLLYRAMHRRGGSHVAGSVGVCAHAYATRTLGKAAESVLVGRNLHTFRRKMMLRIRQRRPPGIGTLAA